MKVIRDDKEQMGKKNSNGEKKQTVKKGEMTFIAQPDPLLPIPLWASCCPLHNIFLKFPTSYVNKVLRLSYSSITASNRTHATSMY